MDALYSKRSALAVSLLTTALLAACSSYDGDGNTYTPPPQNAAPSIPAIEDRQVDQDTPVVVEFSVDDAESGAGGVMVSVAVDGGTPFPADGVVLSGSGGMRTLTLTPLEAATGTAVFDIRAVDPQGLASTRRFQVMVNAKLASARDLILSTFAKPDAGEATMLNGLTVQQDADDPAIFAGLIPADE